MAPREHVVLVARCMVVCTGVWAGMTGQVRAAAYVVDPAAPGAADTDPGTEAKPVQTVQRAAAADIREGALPAWQAEGVKWLRREGNHEVWAVASGEHDFSVRAS